jgi:hypothetical protein
VSDATGASSDRKTVTGTRRAAGSHSGVMAHSPRGSAGRAMSAAVIVLAVGVAAVWSFVARRQLSTSIAQEAADHLEHARVAFQAFRMRTLDNLRAHCRVMVEDPRLKSTLATEGVDEATIADILNDLVKLRRAGFLMILAPDGKVFAVAGADELRGLDLSESSPVKKARTSLEAVVGSWVIGGKIMDLSVMGVRFGTTPIAYLVVGQAVDQDMLKAVADQTGVAVASAIGETVTLTSSPDDALQPVVAAVAAHAGSFSGRLFERDGQTYVTAISEIEDTGPSRPRLVLVQSLARSSIAFEAMRWLIGIPPFLMFIAVLFAMTAKRRTAVTRHPRGRE